MKKGKKFIALFLIFSLLTLSANLYAKEKRGAKLIVTKKDGQLIEGELIAVKENSLVLIEQDSGADVTVDVDNVSVIKIVRGFDTGFKVGVGLGVAEVLVTAARGKLEGGNSILNVSLKALVWGLLFGLADGGLSSIDKTIQIEGKSDSEIKKALEKLRKKARMPDYK